MKTFWKIFLLILIIIIISVGTTISPALYKNVHYVDKHSNITITGHRGAGNLAPENTIAAISQGLAYGVDRIEVDVRQSKDGVVYLMHDAMVDRTTDGSGKIADLTSAEINKLDAGAWFNGKFQGEHVPTLEEALKAIDGKAKLVIEIKDGSEVYPGIEKNVVDLVKKYNATDWVIIHSFRTDILEKIHQLEPKIELHKLFVFKTNILPVLYDLKLHISTVPHLGYTPEVSVYYKFVNPWLIKRVHQLGMKINAWTVDDLETAQRLVSIGIDGIITNSPDIMQKLK